MQTAAHEAEALVLEPKHLTMVRAILADVTPGQRVWAFGSRASGRHVWRFSDLDLAFEGELTWRQRGALDEAFDESDLPMKVDLVELPMIDPEFADRIRRDFVSIQACE
jgi:predicted nucleotidyltransferase